MESKEMVEYFLEWQGMNECPLAGLLLTADHSCLIGVGFVLKNEEKPIRLGSFNPVLEIAAQQLTEYMAGSRQVFDLPLRIGGTDFQQQVWRAMVNIPYGTTLSYANIAEGLGNAHKARAVGQAANRNNLPIIIPCHRVIGSGGKLVGFASGIATKEFLLQHELQVSRKAGQTFRLVKRTV
jgi:methylated-DNA-[protein]-cysteine S-methyltransferase